MAQFYGVRTDLSREGEDGILLKLSSARNLTKQEGCSAKALVCNNRVLSLTLLAYLFLVDLKRFITSRSNIHLFIPGLKKPEPAIAYLVNPCNNRRPNGLRSKRLANHTNNLFSSNSAPHLLFQSFRVDRSHVVVVDLGLALRAFSPAALLLPLRSIVTGYGMDLGRRPCPQPGSK